MIYLVMMDGSKLTEPQHHRLLEQILLLGDGQQVPLKWNAVDVLFETVLDRVHMVVDKLIGVPDRFPRPVVCAWCGNRYRALTPSENTQGDDCASSVFQVTDAVLARVKDPIVTPHGQPELQLGEWLVQGHYGSSDYDCTLWRFVHNPPAAAAGPICDNCVGERRAVGDLKQIDGQYPW
jgi:hypothetical protein